MLNAGASGFARASGGSGGSGGPAEGAANVGNYGTSEDNVSATRRQSGERKSTIVHADDKAFVIHELPRRITVSMVDLAADPPTIKTVTAKDAEQLRAKYPDAHAIYERHAIRGGDEAENVGGDRAEAVEGAGQDNPAARLLREQLQEQLKNADNPQVRSLLEQALREFDKAR